MLVKGIVKGMEYNFKCWNAKWFECLFLPVDMAVRPKHLFQGNIFQFPTVEMLGEAVWC